MDISKLKRDGSKVQTALRNVGDTVVASKVCKIYTPEKYMGSPLGVMENDIKILGIYGIVVDGYYGVSRAATLLGIEPSTVNNVLINDTEYLEFTFQPGDKVVSNINVVQSSTLLYWIYNEIISKGKVPWYISDMDLAQLFDTAKLHANGNLHGDPAILELIAAVITRDSKDKMVYYRHSSKGTPSFVPLSSVGYGATNTTSKLLGSHLAEGITSALTVESKQNESIEDLLRK